MKNLFIFQFLFFFFIINPIFSQSYSVENLSNPKINNSYILDSADTIHKDDIIILNKLFSEIEENNKAQIALVILPTIGDEVPKEFAVKLFEKWKIGEKETDRGLLFLFVLDQHRFEFETGYGLEGILPDIVLKKIADSVLVPKLKEKKITVGIYDTIVEINKILTDESTLSLQDFELKKKLRIEEAQHYGKEKEPLIPEGYEWLVWTTGIIYIILSILIIFYWIGTYIEYAESDENLQTRKEKLNKQWFNIFFWLTAFFFLFPMIIVGFVLYSMRKGLDEEQIDCPNCKNHTLEKLTLTKSKTMKDKGELLEESLENALTTIWCCTSCGHIKKEKKILEESPNRKCPSCQYYTLKHKFVKTIVPATTSDSGSEEWLLECKNCGHSSSRIQVTPKKPLNKPSSHKSSSSSSSVRSKSSSHSSSRSWGGGRSGGGGYGGSW
jgi:uncharacterized protein